MGLTSATDLAISSITYAELCVGIEHGQAAFRIERWAQLHLFTRLLKILPVDESVARVYGRIRAHLSRKGRPIGNNDLFIAAHACALNAALVTSNVREFKRVPELKLENWV